MTFHLMFRHIIFSLFWAAEWSPFGKELPTRLTICFLCILSICNFSYLVLGQDLGSDCFSSWSLHTCYFGHEIFLRPFILFRLFKKSSCEFIAKECKLSTGKLRPEGLPKE